MSMNCRYWRSTLISKGDSLAWKNREKGHTVWLIVEEIFGDEG